VASEYAGLEVMTTYEQFQQTHSPGVPSDPEAPCSIYFTSDLPAHRKRSLGAERIDHFMRWEIKAVGAGPGTRVSN